jgi:hypothetical protein
MPRHIELCELYEFINVLHGTKGMGEGTPRKTGNCNATAISEKNRLIQAGNWLPD